MSLDHLRGSLPSTTNQTMKKDSDGKVVVAAYKAIFPLGNAFAVVLLIQNIVI